MADDFVPVEADARRDQQTISEEPAIFGIGADFGVVLLVPRGGGESGVTSAGERCVQGRGEAQVGRSQRVGSAEE